MTEQEGLRHEKAQHAYGTCHVCKEQDYLDCLIYDGLYWCEKHYRLAEHIYECGECGDFSCIGIPVNCPRGHTDIHHAEQSVEDLITKERESERKHRETLLDFKCDAFNRAYYNQHH